MSAIGIIAALPAEAACLYNKKLKVQSPVEIQKDVYLCLSGIGHDSARQAARKCLEYNINALMSWGVAGALDMDLISGDLILADSIIGPNQNYQISTEWLNKLVTHLSTNGHKVLSKTISSRNEICATTENKKHLFMNSSAIAVEMESSAIAEIAHNNHLDFMAVRTIADNAATSIPEAVLNHTNNLGNPYFFKFIGSCISKPSQIKEMIILAKSYKKALMTLKKIALELKKKNFFYV